VVPQVEVFIPVTVTLDDVAAVLRRTHEVVGPTLWPEDWDITVLAFPSPTDWFDDVPDHVYIEQAHPPEETERRGHPYGRIDPVPESVVAVLGEWASYWVGSYNCTSALTIAAEIGTAWSGFVTDGGSRVFRARDVATWLAGAQPASWDDLYHGRLAAEAPVFERY
jgi:hypothetical protein